MERNGSGGSLGNVKGYTIRKSNRGNASMHRPMDWDETDMRQLADGRWQSGKLVGSVGTHVGHAADEVWKTGARSDYAFESSDVYTLV
jgi:hypothetical protein